MRERLSRQDKWALRYETRSGFLITLGFLVLFGAVIGYQLVMIEPEDRNFTNNELFVCIAILCFMSFMLGYSINRKFYIDLQNGEKLIEEKKVLKKEYRIDYEAGSGSMALWQKMRPFDSYKLVIGKQKYSVDKELYEKVPAGGKVYFHIAPISEHLIRIESSV